LIYFSLIFQEKDTTDYMYKIAQLGVDVAKLHSLSNCIIQTLLMSDSTQDIEIILFYFSYHRYSW